MVNKIHFGKRMSALRRKVGLSQADLAEKLGVTSQAVSKWECGNAVPDIDILLELSHLYNGNPSWTKLSIRRISITLFSIFAICLLRTTALTLFQMGVA